MSLKTIETTITEKNKTSNGTRAWLLRCTGCKPRGGVIVESNDMTYLREEAARHKGGDHRDHKEAFPELYFGTPENIENAARTKGLVAYEVNWLGMQYRVVMVVLSGEYVRNWVILPQAGELVTVPREALVMELSEIPDHFKKAGPLDHWAI